MAGVEQEVSMLDSNSQCTTLMLEGEVVVDAEVELASVVLSG